MGGLPGLPAPIPTATEETDEHLDGLATVQIDHGLRTEGAVALPACVLFSFTHMITS